MSGVARGRSKTKKAPELRVEEDGKLRTSGAPSLGAPDSTEGQWTKKRYGVAAGALSIATTMLVHEGPCRVRAIYINNKSGASVWLGVSDRATTLANLAVPDFDAAASNSTGGRLFDGGEGGFPCDDGLVISLSKTQQVHDNTTTVTGITLTVLYAPTPED